MSSRAGRGLALAGCVAAACELACGDRRIIFCDAGFDPTTQVCREGAGGAGAGGGGAGGSSGSAAGSSGAGGTLPTGGSAGGGAGGSTGGVAGAPVVDASAPSSESDAGEPLDAAVAP